MKKINNFFAFFLFQLLHKFFLFVDCKSKERKILFVNLAKLGDIVISTVLFSNEKQLTDKKDVFFLINEDFKDLFVNYRGKINILFVNIHKYKVNLFYRFRILYSLKKKCFDSVYNLSFTRISIDDEISIIAALGGKSYAYENNPKLKRIFNKKFDEKYYKILNRNGGTDLEKISQLLKYEIKDNVFENNLLYPVNSHSHSIEGKFFVVSPYSSLKIKEWGIEKYSELIEKLTHYYEFTAVILHSEKTIDFDNYNRVINLTGKTSLSEVLSLINNAEFFIGNDSGLMHIAKALRKKVFGIIGGGVLGRIYPYNSKDKTNYFYVDTVCKNCDWQCKFEKPFCLTDVSVEEVFLKITEVIIDG